MIETEWPATALEEVPRCPVCATDARKLMFEGLVDRVFAIAPGRWNLFECDGCGSAYLDPRPTPESIGQAYQGYYTHDAADHRFVRRIGKMRRVLHDLVNGYQNQRYGTNWEHADVRGKWLLPLFPSLRAAADAECRHLPRLPATGGRLLDVGCGNGGFLALARQAGWSIEGVDFDEGGVAAARSRGLSVRCGGIELFDGGAEVFDVVTISHVIEHVYDPRSMLRRIHRLLKPGGMLWLETPNMRSSGAKRYGENWRGLEVPRHLVLFSRKSLVSSLRNTGFRSIGQKWRGMSVFDVYAASDAIAGGHLGIDGSYGGRPPWHAIRAELAQMVFPAQREFLTYTARK